MEVLENVFRLHSPVLRWAVVLAWVCLSVCAFRLVRARRTPQWAWFGIATLALGYAFETGYPLRYALTEILRNGLREIGGEEAIRTRRPLQAAVIACLLTVGACLAFRLARARALGWPVKLGLLGVGLTLTGFGLDAISLHQLDQTRVVYPGFRLTGLGTTAVGVGWAWRRPVAVGV